MYLRAHVSLTWKGSPRRSFAWADSLWFGEGFDYQGTSADWWLLETSGLPYGLTGDMIGACPPNRWLGMVFGASTLDLSDLVFSDR